MAEDLKQVGRWQWFWLIKSQGTRNVWEESPVLPKVLVGETGRDSSETEEAQKGILPVSFFAASPPSSGTSGLPLSEPGATPYGGSAHRLWGQGAYIVTPPFPPCDLISLCLCFHPCKMGIIIKATHLTELCWGLSELIFLKYEKMPGRESVLSINKRGKDMDRFHTLKCQCVNTWLPPTLCRRQ